MGRFSRQLARTGSSSGASVQILEWHVMHTLVAGMPAVWEDSTDVWQNRQVQPQATRDVRG